MVDKLCTPFKCAVKCSSLIMNISHAKRTRCGKWRWSSIWSRVFLWETAWGSVTSWTHLSTATHRASKGNIFLAHFTCHVTWKGRNKSLREMPEQVVLMKNWWVCFWQALKRSRQMACSVWVQASVTDQERGRHTRERKQEQARPLSRKPNSPVVSARNGVTGDWDARAVSLLSLLHSFINTVQYLPVTSQTAAPFPTDCYWFNRRLQLFVTDVIDWKGVF